MFRRLMALTVPHPSGLLDRLQDPSPLVAVELRPPRSGLSFADSMETWIDMYHAIRKLLRGDTVVFLTDNAVGQSEEENLQHLTVNLAEEVDTSKVVPFLTCKHSLTYCLMYATRAVSHGFRALTVLGGDQAVGPPRCVPHAYELRQRIRERTPSLALGGWVNPHGDPVEQVDFVLQEGYTAEFYLSQIVSHHDVRKVEAFLNEASRRNVRHPGVFGVFLYRSPNPSTLARLASYFPVPVEGITNDFASGLAPEAICAQSIRSLRAVGVSKVYVSNLGFRKIDDRYRRILDVLEPS